MKFLDKLALKVFSIIIVIIAIITILLITNIISVDMIVEKISFLSNYGDTAFQVTIAIVAVLLLLAIKGLFFTSKQEDLGKDGIILENTSGKLVISKESLENLIASVIKEIPGAETVSSRTFLDKHKNLIVFVTAIVSKDVMLKDISNTLQQKIKEAMKKTADLDVKEVNIKIKNITSKKVKGLPPSSDAEENSEEVDVEENESTESKEKETETEQN